MCYKHNIILWILKIYKKVGISFDFISNVFYFLFFLLTKKL